MKIKKQDLINLVFIVLFLVFGSLLIQINLSNNQIEDVSIYNRTLNDLEILKIYKNEYLIENSFNDSFLINKIIELETELIKNSNLTDSLNQSVNDLEKEVEKLKPKEKQETYVKNKIEGIEQIFPKGIRLGDLK